MVVPEEVVVPDEVEDQVIDPEVVPVVAPEFHDRDPSVPVRPAIPPRPMTPLVRPDDPIVDDDDPETTTFNETFL